jgi:hypothetical protein
LTHAGHETSSHAPQEQAEQAGLAGWAAARAGDVREMPTDPSRWQQHDGKKWQRKCEAPGCGKRPNLGTEFKVPRRCGEHREKGDVDVVSARPGRGAVGGLHPKEAAAGKRSGLSRGG